MALTSVGADVATNYEQSVVAHHVRRAFGARTVLNGVELSVPRNEFVALLGRSGTGKSTFLRILGGLDADYQGEVLVPARRSVVFQEARLMPWRKVLPNVLLGMRQVPHGREALQERGLAALAEVGLIDQADAWPVTLSGGEAQRVALARAFVREPQLMLLDEPFGALDALTRARMHGLLQTLCIQHRPAVVLVTHDVDEAILLADRAVVLTDGHISLDLPIDMRRPRERSSPAFGELRRRLLVELGVPDETRTDAPLDARLAHPAFGGNSKGSRPEA